MLINLNTMKQRRINTNTSTSNNNDIDRISQLPEFLLQHIQSFLPTKDGARSCLVSKPWLHSWSTRPFLDFDQSTFTSIDRKAFFELVNNTLAKYQSEGLCIEKFSLDVKIGHDASFVDTWLSIVLRNKVQELSLVDLPYSRYVLPRFTSNSLIVLKLSRLRFVLNDREFIRCPNLKKLVLIFVMVSDQTIQNLSSSFPLLEELHLTHCVGLEKICVVNLLYLKIFRCGLHSYSGDEVRVETPKLESFTCSHYVRSNGRFIIEPYHNLRSFSVFCNKSLTDTGLCDLLSKCPLLEDLSLHSCFLLKRIHIASHSLKRLSLKLDSWQSKIVEVTIDAPNLCSLEYHDYKLSYLSLVSPLVQAQTKSSIRAGKHEILDAEWFCKLGLLLKNFKTSDLTLNAVRSDIKDFIAAPSSRVREIEALNLSVEIKVSLPFRFLVSGLFSSCHPKMIYVVWGDDQAQFIQCLCYELLWRSRLSLSASNGVHFWWHYLEDAKVEILSKTQGKWIQLYRKRFLDASLNLEVGTELRFTLKWCAEEY